MALQPQEALCHNWPHTVTAPTAGFLGKTLLGFLHAVHCFAGGEVKDVGWSAPRVEIEARTITENLDRFTELGTAPGVKEPISYLQTISSLEALLRPHIPLPWSAATFPLCRENLDCGGNLADNANSLSLIFPLYIRLACHQWPLK